MYFICGDSFLLFTTRINTMSLRYHPMIDLVPMLLYKNHLRQVSVLSKSQNNLLLCEFKLKWLQCKLTSSIISGEVFSPSCVGCHVTINRNCRVGWSYVCQNERSDRFHNEFLSSELKSCENSVCSNIYSIDPTRSHICTCHDSWAVQNC